LTHLVHRCAFGARTELLLCYKKVADDFCRDDDPRLPPLALFRHDVMSDRSPQCARYCKSLFGVAD